MLFFDKHFFQALQRAFVASLSLLGQTPPSSCFYLSYDGGRVRIYGARELQNVSKIRGDKASLCRSLILQRTFSIISGNSGIFSTSCVPSARNHFCSRGC